MGYEHNTNNSDESMSKYVYYNKPRVLSMKRRQTSPEEWSSPKAGKEVRDLLQRLVEIDSESRQILLKMTSLIAKDDKIESYVYKRIKDPKSSRMWDLIVQLVGMRNEDTNLDQIIMNEEEDVRVEDEIIKTKSINVEDGMNGEIRNERFKVKNLLNGTEGEVVVSSTKTSSTSSSSNDVKRIMLKQ